ncbi:MAG: hypothetical protein IPJ34_03100 [Myxococcales bacterium]|nr:hypothetical protein [Myxococcales bacterium]
MAVKKRPARPAALDRAEHNAAPVKLTKEQRATLQEALRRGEDLREELEAKLTAYGRWLLEVVFAGDAAAAIDDRSKNPVWLELVRRAGGPTLAIGRRMLFTSVRIAAYDRRLTDQAWRNLDVGRKELLLPLSDDDRLREAAQHVAKWNLTQTKTREYVGQLLGKDGKARQLRLTAPLLAGRVRKLRDDLGSAPVLRRVKELRTTLSVEDRAALAEELDGLRSVLVELARAVRGR